MYVWPVRAIRDPVRKMTRPGEVGAPPSADDPRRWLIAIVIRSSTEPVQGALIVNLRNILEAMDAVAEAQPVRVAARRAPALSGRPESVA